MKIFVLVFLAAFVAYSSADCGCLKCSKHLTVVGRTAPTCDNGGTTVIYRGVPDQFDRPSLPVKVQAPLITPISPYPTGSRDLEFKVLEYTTCPCLKLQDFYGNIYNARIEVPAPVPVPVPVPVPAPAPACVTNTLKPCVDRVVVPPPPPRCVNGFKQSAPIIRPPSIQQPNQVKPSDSCEECDQPKSSEEIDDKPGRYPIFVNRKPVEKLYQQYPVYVSCKQDQIPYGNPNGDIPIYVNPGKIGSIFVSNKFPTVDTVDIPCQPTEPAGPTDVKTIERYINSVNSPLGSTVQVDGGDSLVEIPRPLIKNRSKRDIPFLKPGYKFVMNMLPDFIQKPIKNTVNDLALTHPDERLQKLYNRPPPLSLRQKLEIHRKNNLALLKNKFRNRIIKNKLGTQSYADDFNRGNPYEPSSYTSHHDWPKGFGTGSNERPYLSRQLDNYLDSLVYPDLINQPLKMKNLHRLNGNQDRYKRESAYEKYWLKRFKKDANSKKLPGILEASEIVLPFYHVKEHPCEEENSYNAHLRSEFVSSSSDNEKDKYRYRRGSGQPNFLKPYSVKDVVNENRNIKEAFLRNVIRDELNNFRVEKQESQNMVRSTEDHYSQQMPQSSLLDIMTLPIKFISNFNEIAKVAKGTKKYFKNFGKNFRKHFLHLTSDLMGDFRNMDTNRNIFIPRRHRRSFDQTKYDSNASKTRQKRYILKEVDEDEVEEYILEKLSTVFEEPGYASTERDTNANFSPFWVQHNDEERKRKFMLEHVKPKLILDNNGKPFLEINGFKRPLRKKLAINNAKKSKIKQPAREFRFHDTSDEADREKIASLIDHAKNHLETIVGSTNPDMPIKTVKERVSQLLYETDVLIHMDFDKYDGIYDDLIALQHTKRAIVQDWKRLIVSEAINDISAKTSLLERFEELQHYKDLTLADIVASLYEDSENIFISKKLIKMLVRLQKLQCIINQVVANFQHHLHISRKSEIAKEIEYVDLLDGLNFALKKSRNDMIQNLIKDRDVALHRNINVLDKLKKLLVSPEDEKKVGKEAELVWEMRNIEKMQKNTIEEMKHKLDTGYNVKNELKILFDLLKRYEFCEEDQKKLLSKLGRDRSEEKDESSEIVGAAKYKKPVLKRKLDVKELKKKWEESLRKQKILLKKEFKKNMRRIKMKKGDSYEDD